MFNDRFELTQAVLECRKTQTRRFVKYPIEVRGKRVGYYHYDRISCRVELMDDDEFSFCPESYVMPMYKVGEVVAVAQRYSNVYAELLLDWEKHNYHLPREMSAEKFREKYEHHKGWENKMFVKPELMPYQVKITNVRLQQLQEITDEECLKEGVYIFDEDYMNPLAYIYTYHGANQLFYHPRDAYAHMIDALSGKGTWGSNPYVFVYDFELVR